MTIQHLGFMRALVNRERRRVPVFAMWLDDPDASILSQIPDPLACPSCGGPVDLSRVRADRTFENPAVRSTAVACSQCGAVLHFDKTPAEKRVLLTWTQRFEKE